MLATPSDFREVDFSHLHIQVDELEGRSRMRSSGRYLLAGLFISVLLHGLLLLWQKTPTLVSPPKNSSTEIHLTLHQARVQQQKIDEVPVQHENPSVTTTPNPNVIAPEEQAVSNFVEPVIEHQVIEQKPRIITTLSRDELSELRGQSWSAPTPAPIQKRGGSIGDNVFHPGLRKRLQIEEGKPDFQRVDSAPKTHIDPSGATIVGVDGGGCLRSSVTNKTGDAQNWYMTPCGGKSESERMMERINQDANGKLTFDE